MTWLHTFFWSVFFIPADGRGKSAQQLISTVLPFHPRIFSMPVPNKASGQYSHCLSFIILISWKVGSNNWVKQFLKSSIDFSASAFLP